MPVPSAITDLSTTLASNSPAGSDNVFPNLDDYLRAHAQFVALLRDGRGLSTEVSLASASTCDIGGAASMFVQITGTTTITSFGANYQPRVLRFAAALTLTHNASTLILPTGANITTAAGDTCLVVPVGTSGWRVLQYQRASEGADFVSFLQAGSGAASRTVQSKLRDVVSVLDFGAVGDGVADDTVAIQAALDTGRLVNIPTGVYKTTAPLIIGVSDAGLKGEGNNEVWGSTIDYYGTDAAIKIFDSGVNKRVTSYRVEDLAIKVRTSGGDGIDFSHGSYGTFKNIWIRLLESNQSGVYGSGNTLGSSPYYNQFDNIKIFGNANNTTYPNQRGFYFVGDGSGFGADGPNANLVSNCGQIAGLSHGVHIESGVGNLFSNIIMESIADYAYRIGKAATAAVGRADENMVVNHWMEGNSSCVFVRFEGDANANSLTNFSVNSIGPILWDNQSSSVDNFVKAKGNLYVVDFYGENIPASATTVLKPTSPAWSSLGFGGVIPPFRCVPYVMQVTAQNFSSGGLGTGLVKAYRTGVQIPALQFTIQDVGTARFGGKAIQSTPDVTAAYNTFDGSINSQIEVTITTDAAWNQTSADVHVQVVFVS